jgi:hypothetical protein
LSRQNFYLVIIVALILVWWFCCRRKKVVKNSGIEPGMQLGSLGETTDIETNQPAGTVGTKFLVATF